MSNTKILENELTRFGLSARQAETYVFLLTKRACSARQIATETNMNRSDTYRVLSELFDHGLVEKQLFDSKKTFFTPIPPGQAINRLLARKKREIDELSKSVEELTTQLDRVESDARKQIDEPMTSNVSFRIIAENRVLDTVEQLFHNAKHEIDIVISGNSLARWFVRGIDDVLREMVNQGVTVKIITKIDNRNLPEVKRCTQFCQIKHTENTIYNTCIIDGNEALTGTPTGANGEPERYQAYLETGERGIVDTLKTFFERTWEISSDAKEKLKSIRLAPD